MKKEVIITFVGVVLAIVLLQLASAGIGIKWEQESFIVNENEKTCVTYSVYNPWPEDTSVRIELADTLKDVMVSQEAETKLIPADTSSADAIPLKFCFKVPRVYGQDCLVAGQLCKQECGEQPVEYTGEVVVKSVPIETKMSGAGGSTTSMAVSAPLRLRIECNAHPRDYSLIYIILGIISLIVILVVLYRKHRKPESERKREELESLRERMIKLKAKK